MAKKNKEPVVLQVLPEMNHGGVEMGERERRARRLYPDAACRALRGYFERFGSRGRA